MNLAAGYDHRLGAALAASVVIHAGAMMLSPSTPKVPSHRAPVPLHVELMLDSASPAQEMARPVAQAAAKPARAKRAPLKREATPPASTSPRQSLPPAEAIQTSPTADEAPATTQDLAAPQPITAPLQPTPESVALLAPAPPPRPAPSAELLSDYTRSLSRLLDRYKEYPRIAELRGWEGSVTMRLRVAPSGRLIAAEVHKSSGYAALDKQAITMVSRAGVLPVPPEGLDAAEVPVLVPINFRLER